MAPGSPAAGTQQVTPTNSLSRSPPRRIESALYGCAMLLASVALGLDVRELPGAQAAEDPEPKEERKTCDRVLQQVTRPRRVAADRPRPPATCEGPGALGLLSRPSLSTRCLLQAEGEDLFEGSVHITHGPDVPTPALCPAFEGGHCDPTFMPRREANRSVWRHLGPPCSEHNHGNRPPCVSAKERAARHRWTMSDGNASQAPGKLHLGEGPDSPIDMRMLPPYLGTQQVIPFPSDYIYKFVFAVHTDSRIPPYSFI